MSSARASTAPNILPLGNSGRVRFVQAQPVEVGPGEQAAATLPVSSGDAGASGTGAVGEAAPVPTIQEALGSGGDVGAQEELAGYRPATDVPATQPATDAVGAPPHV